MASNPLEWYIIATPVGTLLGRTNEFNIQGLFYLYDACIVTSKPSLLYVAECDVGKPLSDIQTYSPEQAKALGFIDEERLETEHVAPANCDILTVNTPALLVEVEGSIQHDYVPIRSSIDYHDTPVVVCGSNIIFYYKINR